MTTFTKSSWVKTVMFDGSTPYIGFTYKHALKGNCIKGEDISGLQPEEIKARLHASFPSSTMEGLPDDHPMIVLTADEIAEYELPNKPDWASFFGA